MNRFVGRQVTHLAFAVFVAGGLLQADFGRPVKAGDLVLSQSVPQELRIGKASVNRVLFLGNSITLHGPAPQIGWTGEWGMAATAREFDFVHRLLDRIALTAGGEPSVKIRNIADFERSLSEFNIREQLRQELAFNPDVVILAIGENAASPTTEEGRMQFATAFANLLSELKQSRDPQPLILVRSQFWRDKEKDILMKQASLDAGVVFVDIGDLGTDPSHSASSERTIEHAGVAAHPGDKGMQAIADALWNSLQHVCEVAE